MEFDADEYYREQDVFATPLLNELRQFDARLSLQEEAIESLPVATPLEMDVSAFQDLSNTDSLKIERDDCVSKHYMNPEHLSSKNPLARAPSPNPRKSHSQNNAISNTPRHEPHERMSVAELTGPSRNEPALPAVTPSVTPVGVNLRGLSSSALSPRLELDTAMQSGLRSSSPAVSSPPASSPGPQAYKRHLTPEARRSPPKKAKVTKPMTMLTFPNVSVETDIPMEDISSFSTQPPPPVRAVAQISKPSSPKKRVLPAPLPPPPAKRQRRMAPSITIPATSSPPSTAPSSPIDDFSNIITAQPTMLDNNDIPRGQKSSLLLDVRSRVAKFSAQQKETKKGKGKTKSNRVVNLHEGEQSRCSDGPGDMTSIIIVDSQEEYLTSNATPAPAPAVSTSRLPPKSQAKKSVPKPGPAAKPVVPTKTATKTVTRKKAEKPPDPKKATNKKLQMSYVAYVEQQVKEWTENPLPKEKMHAQCLKDMVIYYFSGSTSSVSPGTQIRVNFMLRHGAKVLPKFDAKLVTHIVAEEKCSASKLLATIRVKKLSRIPDHIPTITWNWVVDDTHIDLFEFNSDGIQHECDIERKRYFMYALFSDRINAGESSSPAKPRRDRSLSLSSFDGDELPVITAYGSRHKLKNKHGSDISDSEEERQPLAVQEGEASSSRRTLDLPNDPLTPFYQKARLDLDRTMYRRKEIAESDTEDDAPAPAPAPRRRRYACDNKPSEQITSGKENPNQYVIDKLTELMEIHRVRLTQDDKWRVYSYTKSIRALKESSKKIASLSQAKKLRGVGDKTAEKIMEIIETGNLRRLEYEQEDQDVKTMQLFNGIYGVGPATAMRWCANGCKTLDDLLKGKNGVKLTEAQRIGIKYYDDINARMPREETKRLFELIKPIALSIDPKLFVEVMGSYRRGKATCGDIDIMITRCPSDGITHEGVLETLLRKLHAADILTEDLAILEDFDEDENIYRGLCHLPQEKGSRMRRIDFLCVPWASRGAALLYYTGDDIFNRAMRYKAGNMGYSLNQRGLSEGVIRDTRDRRIKLNKGTIVASETEEEIFKMLNVPWQEPHERVRA